MTGTTSDQDRLVVVFCARRTGSSTVMGAFRNHSNSFGYGELFNRKDQLSSFYNPGFERFLSETLAPGGQTKIADGALRRKDPVATVRAAQEFSRTRSKYISAFKVMPNQRMFKSGLADVLNQFQPYVFLLSRSAIDSFISHTKARMTDQWGSYDTTDMKVQISARAFLAYRSYTAAFYDRAVDLVRRCGLEYTHLDYDTLFCSQRSVSEEVHLACSKVGLTLGKLERHPNARRQDKASSPAEKVSNWQQLLSDLRQENAAHLLHYPYA